MMIGMVSSMIPCWPQQAKWEWIAGLANGTYCQIYVNHDPGILLVAVDPYILGPNHQSIRMAIGTRLVAFLDNRKGGRTMPLFKFKPVHIQFRGPLAIPFFLITVAVLLGPIVKHVMWCIEAAADTGSAIALLVVGLMFPPVGWVHGVSILLGFGGWIF